MPQITDSIKVLFGNQNRRIMSPLFIPFILFWVYFNWESLVILFFDSKPPSVDRITYVQSHYSDPWNNFWLPFWWALGTLFIAPTVVTLQNLVKSVLSLAELKLDDYKKRLRLENEHEILYMDYDSAYIKEYGIRRDTYHHLDSVAKTAESTYEFISKLETTLSEAYSRESQIKNITTRLRTKANKLNELIQSKRASAQSEADEDVLKNFFEESTTRDLAFAATCINEFYAFSNSKEFVQLQNELNEIRGSAEGVRHHSQSLSSSSRFILDAMKREPNRKVDVNKRVDNIY